MRRGALLLVLLLSLGLRVVLILSGGQNYWPDESRYERSQLAAKALWAGDIAGCLRALNKAEHFLFRVIGVGPASLELAVGANPKIPALFFSLFSVACLLVMWGIVRRLGESERVALSAVGLLALCSSFLYYSRHLLPYDAAMAFGLLALFMGLRTPLRAVDSLACGFLAACAFLTYNGYWTLAAFAILVQAFRSPRTPRAGAARAFLAGGAFVVPCAVLVGASSLAGGIMLREFIAFSGTVRQGSYAEGWSLPVAYLWHAEHLFVLLWAVALFYGMWEIARGSRSEAIIVAIGGLAWIYGCLVVFSVLLGRMVVYGRLARQLVPFVCIAAALLLARIRTGPRGRAVVGIVWVLAVCQAIVNLHRPLTQVFPRSSGGWPPGSKPRRERASTTCFTLISSIRCRSLWRRQGARSFSSGRTRSSFSRFSTRAGRRTSAERSGRGTSACASSGETPPRRPI